MDVLHQFLGEAWKLWLAAGIIFFLAEGVNSGTFALFFGGAGALATAALCRFVPAVNGSLIYQLLIFSAMSISSLVFLRPTFMRLLQNGEKPDGPDAYVGKQARTITVLRMDGAEDGRVIFEGTEWRAMPGGDCTGDIPAGRTVEIVKIEGLTLLVKPQ